MADVRKLKNFYKSSDLEEGSKVTFVSAGEIKDIDFSREKDGSKVKKALEIDIKINEGDPKKFVPNATTVSYLRDQWGPDTAKWVGKVAKVQFMKQSSFGKVMNVPFFEPVKGPEKAWDDDLDGAPDTIPMHEESSDEPDWL